MEPSEIFDLIVKADEKLKYATAGRGDRRANQAADLLQQAIAEATAIGNDALVQQARVRLADIEALTGQAVAGSDGTGDGGDGPDAGSGPST